MEMFATEKKVDNTMMGETNMRKKCQACAENVYAIPYNTLMIREGRN